MAFLTPTIESILLIFSSFDVFTWSIIRNLLETSASGAGGPVPRLDVNLDVPDAANEATGAICYVVRTLLASVIHGVIDGMTSTALRAPPTSFDENAKQEISFISAFKSAWNNAVPTLG